MIEVEGADTQPIETIHLQKVVSVGASPKRVAYLDNADPLAASSQPHLNGTDGLPSLRDLIYKHQPTETISWDTPLHKAEIDRLYEAFETLSTVVDIREKIQVPDFDTKADDRLHQFLDWVNNRFGQMRKNPLLWHQVIHQMNLPLVESENIIGRLFVAGLQDAFFNPTEYIYVIANAREILKNDEMPDADVWYQDALELGERFFGEEWYQATTSK